MLSLQQLLSHHGSLLILDAASAQVQVGWIVAGEPARWAGSDEEAGIGVFRCLAALNVEPAAAGAFGYCEGPGSVLGIRTTAMAVRAWRMLAARPSFAYQSLALLAATAAGRGRTLIADARRDTWHVCREASALQRMPTAALDGALATPASFRHWTPLPPNVERLDYTLSTLWSEVADAPLWRPTETPDAFLHEEPSYVTWQPHIHRAP